MVARPQIDFTEYPGLPQKVQEVVYARQRVTIAYGSLIEGAIVYAHSEGALFFPHEDDRCSPLGAAGPHPALGKVLVKLFAHFCQLRLAHAVLARFWRRLRGVMKRYAVGYGPFCGQPRLIEHVDILVTHNIPPRTFSRASALLLVDQALRASLQDTHKRLRVLVIAQSATKLLD